MRRKFAGFVVVRVAPAAQLEGRSPSISAAGATPSPTNPANFRRIQRRKERSQHHTPIKLISVKIDKKLLHFQQKYAILDVWQHHIKHLMLFPLGEGDFASA
jgi:hypothetical protein